MVGRNRPGETTRNLPCTANAALAGRTLCAHGRPLRTDSGAGRPGGCAEGDAPVLRCPSGISGSYRRVSDITRDRRSPEVDRSEAVMTIVLDHTIVPVQDAEASARF